MMNTFFDWFEHVYPYTNFHELNIDWCINTVKMLSETMKEFVTLNTIKYADPIQWNITHQYEKNTVVVDPLSGTAYISTQPVPSGVGINNTDYWSVIFTMDVVSANKNITLRDDANNMLATFESFIGDWLLWNGTLYVVTRDIEIGQAYTVDYNLERATVELFMKKYLEDLANEINATIGSLDNLTTTDKDSIVDAINELVIIIGSLDNLTTTDKDSIVDAINEVVNNVSDLSGNIGDLDDLTTTDKDSVVDAINEVVNNVSDLSDNIGDLDNLTTTDKDSVVDAINEVNTFGIYNNSTPDSDLTTNIGLREGTYNITENTTINAQLVVPKGAVLNVASGVTLTINGSIEAGRYKIFDGPGTIVVDNTKQSFGYPEWFSDDVKKCYDVFNNVYLAARDYVIDGDLVIQRANSSIIGVGYGTYVGESNKTSRLIFTTGRLIIGRWDTSVINEYSINITIRGVNITYSGTLEAISVYGVIRCIIEDCYIFVTTENGASRGIHFYFAIGSFFHRCYVQVVDNGITFIGYDIENSNNAKRNASIWLTECSFGDTGSPTGRSYGFMLHGSLVSDIYLDKCEVAVANVGLSIDGLTDSNSVDILINQCDFDSIKENCIVINNCTANGAITFTNVYVAPQVSSQYAMFAIYSSAINIIARAIQLIDTNNQIGIQAVNCVPHLIGDFIMRTTSNPVVVSDQSKMHIEYFVNGNLVTIPV